MGNVGLERADAFPGWPRVEAHLLACLGDGDDAKLSAPDVMVVLGEMARVREQCAATVRVLRAVRAGDGCWSSEQGYASCVFRDVERVLDGVPLRRPWWRRLRSTAGR